MSAEYTNNHYVPQWYQRRFIPAAQADRELYLLDLKPEWFRDGRGVRRQRKPLRRTGTRKCLAIEDLYTTRFGGIESQELERVFFGEVDARQAGRRVLRTVRHPGAVIVMGYASGATEAMDTLGRRPGDRRIGHEARSAQEIEAHGRWCNEFERLFGEERRGTSWEDRNLERAA